MTKNSSMMRKVMVLVMAFAIMLTYSVVPMNQSFAASGKKPTKITLNAKSKTLTVGQTFKAKVKSVKPKKASKAVKWKSSNKKVATVSSKGVITAKKAGKATITAVSKKNKKAKAKIKVTVKAVTIPAATAEEFAAADFKVDARTADSYAGWALGEDKNGGHLDKAVNISAQWLTCDYYSVPAENKTRDEAIQMEIDDSGLIKGANIVVYDTNDQDADAVAKYLVSKGYKNVKKYNASKEINATGATLKAYKNYQMNVPAEVVKSISDYKVKGTALTDNAKNIVGTKSAAKVKILHAEYAAEGKYTPEGYKKDNPIDWTKSSYYTTGHVPGAEPISTDDFEPEREAKRDIIKTPGATYGNNADIGWIADYLLRDDAELLKLVAKYGVNKDDCVVVVGPEPMATTKIALVLRYAGVNDIHVMTAAYNGWNLNGYDLEKGKINEPKAGTDITAIGNPDLIDSQDEAAALIGDSKAQLIDTRTVEEYNGKDSGYSYHDLVGRINGTINSPSGIGYSSGMYYYRNPDKTMRSQDILEAMWKDQGVDTNKHMSFFCGSGWRAAEETWDAWVLGYNASMYNDGWQGWSNAGRPFIAADGKSYALDVNKGVLVESTVRIDNTADFLNMDKEKVWPHYGVKEIRDNDFVIDVRKASLFKESHYPGSVSAPVIKEDGSEPSAAEIKANLDPAFDKAAGKRIVIVCNTGNSLARRAMNYYQKAGKDMDNIVYFIGGAAQLAAEGKMVKIEFFTMEDAEWATYGTDSIATATDYVVDVRAAKDYEAGHIENAVSVPTDGSAIAAGSDAAKGLDAAYSKAKNEGKRIVFICYSGNRYARRAMDYVYNTYPDEGITPAKVTYLKGGFNGWKTANPYVIGKVKVDPAAKTATIKAKVNAAYLTADEPFIYHLIKSEGVGDKDAAFVSEADVFDFHSALTALGSKPWSDTSASLETGQTLSDAAATGVGSSTFSHYDVTVGEKTLAEVLKYKKNGADASPASALDMAFSGNYENQLAWKSGCISCLQSCPAGIVTNNAVGFMTVSKETDYFCLDSTKLQAGQEVAISFKLK